jgi:hypothetical protein
MQVTNTKLSGRTGLINNSKSLEVHFSAKVDIITPAEALTFTAAIF